VTPTHLSMLLVQPFNFSWIEQSLVGNDTIIRLLVACLLGGIIGLEREFKKHAAGIRTNIGQIASNIVQGIGFLGAGLILHNRSRVSGMTSAACIFVVASIGMATGAGLFAAATAATTIVLIALALVGVLEQKVNVKAYALIYEARGQNEAAILDSVLDAMDKAGERLKNVERESIGSLERVSFSITAIRKKHDLLAAQLRSEPAIETLKIFRDPEEE